MSEERLFFALTGKLEWIHEYLRSRGFPCQFDHIMGDGFYRTFLTSKEYELMKEAAKEKSIDIYCMGISDICHKKHHVFKNIIAKLKGKR